MHDTNMNQYTIAFDDPSCSTWTVFHLEKPVVMPASFGNVVDHFFTGDVFTFDETSGQVTLLSSPVRERPCLVGVVILEGRRTYGQMGKKQLWKCMPLLQDIPPFLLAYDTGPIGFSKVAINRYVSFRFHSWNKEQKHPIASCLSTFGEVIRLDAYTDYYLTHHGLFPRPKMSMVPSSLSSFVDNTPVVTETIFSLDPHGAALFDDALSYNLLPCGSHQIDIFIANVVDTLFANDLWSWASLLDLPSNLYLGERKLSLFPSSFSNQLSLTSGLIRSTIRLRLLYTPSGELVTSDFSVVSVSVSHNYVYGVVGVSSVDSLCLLAKQLAPLQSFPHSFSDDADMQQRWMVSFWMTTFNQQASFLMATHQKPAFWTCPTEPGLHPTRLSLWNSLQEGLYAGDGRVQGLCYHIGSNETGFLKTTSPLRRRIDLWNQALLLECFNSVLRVNSVVWVNSVLPFLYEWDRRAHLCSKLQRNIALLRLAVSCSEELLVGRIVDVSSNQVLVYMEKLRILLWCPTKTDDKAELERKGYYRLYYFELSSHLKKKIRIEFVQWV